MLAHLIFTIIETGKAGAITTVLQIWKLTPTKFK